MTIRFRAVNKDTFEAIRKGEKTFETRANTPKYQKVSPGDELVLVCDGDKFSKVVNSVRVFDSVEELAKHVPIHKVAPGIASLDELIQNYHAFPGYKDKIKIHGLVAWELK